MESSSVLSADSAISSSFVGGSSSQTGPPRVTSTPTQGNNTQGTRAAAQVPHSSGPSAVLNLGQPRDQDPTYSAVLKLAMARAILTKATSDLMAGG